MRLHPPLLLGMTKKIDAYVGYWGYHKRARKRVNADLLRPFCAKAALVLLRRRAAAGRLFSIDAIGWPCMIGLGDVSLA